MIGRSIGEGDIDKAKQYRKHFTIIGMTLASIQLLTMSFAGSYYIYAFTRVPEIIEIVNSVTNIVAFTLFFDCLQGWLQGIIRGLGVQRRAIKYQLFAFYVVCLPLQGFFMFHMKIGMYGIQIGVLIALSILSIYYMYMVFCEIDWSR